MVIQEKLFVQASTYIPSKLNSSFCLESILIGSCFSLISCASLENSSDTSDTSVILATTDTHDTVVTSRDLLWYDEFDGTALDISHWEAEVQAYNWNNELQYYTDREQNVSVQDGSLVLRALEETYTGEHGTREYTSAQIRTKYLYDWTYGQFEVRAKLPYGKGLWPAIWMLPSSETEYGSWPLSGEIDIMELLGDTPERVYGALHYAGDTGVHLSEYTSYTLSDPDFSQDFHTFRLDWEPEEIKWYVDDQLYFTQQNWSTPNATYPAPFDQPFYFILNVAVGGDWPGSPNEETVFPQEMIVDYVRVYDSE